MQKDLRSRRPTNLPSAFSLLAGYGYGGAEEKGGGADVGIRARTTHDTSGSSFISVFGTCTVSTGMPGCGPSVGVPGVVAGVIAGLISDGNPPSERMDSVRDIDGAGDAVWESRYPPPSCCGASCGETSEGIARSNSSCRSCWMGFGDRMGGASCGCSSMEGDSEEEELGILGSNAAVSAAIAGSWAAVSLLIWNFGIISRPG
jgi:hypothetical protein